MSFFEKSMDDLKALMLEWLIKWGKEWVNYKMIAHDDMRFEIGRLERHGLVEYNYAQNLNSIGLGEPIMYRLTPKALQLIEEKV